MLKYYFHCYINYNQDNWTQWIFFTQFVYNNSKYNVMRLILIKILFKIWLQLHIDVNINNEHFKVKKIINHVTSLQNIYA